MSAYSTLSSDEIGLKGDNHFEDGSNKNEVLKRILKWSGDLGHNIEAVNPMTDKDLS
jgi:hypothetical protein